MKSNTQTIWYDLLHMPDYLPTKPPKTIHRQCFLCGGSTNEQAWAFKEAIGGAFTDLAIAKCIESQTVCCACAALTSKDAWVLACEQFKHNPYFPVKDDKKPFLSNWMFASHCFSDNTWLILDRTQARNVLLNPPEPPFVITLAVVGKKHVIFRAHVNYAREQFSVQADDQRINVNRSLFTELLSLVEQGYAMGFSKSSMLTGDYNQAACLKAGLNQWNAFENQLKPWRKRHEGMLFLATFCCIHEL